MNWYTNRARICTRVLPYECLFGKSDPEFVGVSRVGTPELVAVGVVAVGVVFDDGQVVVDVDVDPLAEIPEAAVVDAVVVRCSDVVRVRRDHLSGDRMSHR